VVAAAAVAAAAAAARGTGGVLDVRAARHRNKGVFSTKMQDDLSKSETVDCDADE